MEKPLFRTLQWLALTLATLITGGFLWLELSDLGFPDGHLTALGRLRKVIWPVFITINGLLTLISLYMLSRSVRHREVRTTTPAAVAFAAVNLSCWLLDFVLSLFFENGTGEI